MNPSADREGFGRGDLGPLLCCALYGVLLSALPHLVEWFHTGTWVWIADHDELTYLSWGGRAYLNHPFALRDPATDGPTMYPWIQFGPGIIGAKFLRLGPLGISLVWRVWAGLTIGATWYVVIRHFTQRRWAALVGSVLLLGDVGVVWGKLLFRQLAVSLYLLSGSGGDLLASSPQIHPEWRIITPGLSLPFLLLHVWLVARARDHDSRSNVGLAGAGFGLLFYVYFYFWTAAALAIIGSWWLDRDRRHVYFHTAWIGGLLGLPSVIAGVLLKRSGSTDWQYRMDTFLPIDRFGELLVPVGGILLLLGVFAWIWSRRPDLLYLWALCAAAILLLNHQVVTALQIQNFHWTYVWGPTLSALVLLVGVDMLRPWFSRFQVARIALVVLTVGHMVVAVTLREIEATQTRESVEITKAANMYMEQRLVEAAPPLRRNGTIGGDQIFVDLATIVESQRPVNHFTVVHSPTVEDAEWNFRIALNAFLEGLDRSAFRSRQEEVMRVGLRGPWARSPGLTERRVETLVATYDDIRRNSVAAMDRLNLTYVALPVDRRVPDYITNDWRLVQAGPYWQVWSRR